MHTAPEEERRLGHVVAVLRSDRQLIHRPDVPTEVAINEYVEVANAFYDQGESTFVNSVLDRVARQERAAELAG